MDASALNNMLANTYIPNVRVKPASKIPAHHPSLVMQDYQTDTTHHLSCGCNNGACIEDRAWWFNKTNSASSSCNAEVPRSALATKSSLSPRPVYKSSASSSSISTIQSLSSN